MNLLFENELCVVTGAANGIGKAIAQRFLEEGADLIIADYDDKTASEAFAGNPHVLDIIKADATMIEDLEKIRKSAQAALLLRLRNLSKKQDVLSRRSFRPSEMVRRIRSRISPRKSSTKSWT